MRLIDADKIKEALKSNCKPELCRDYGRDYCELCCPHNDFEDLIDNAPTVEPKMAIIPPEVITKLADSVVEIISNIDWNKALEVYKARPQGEWVNFDQESVYDNTFRDHYFYLLAVKGFGTAIKAKFHDDPLPCFTHYAIQNNVVGEYAIDFEDITHWMHLPTIPGQEEES